MDNGLTAKLTATEILKIVSENYSEDSFCEGEWTDSNVTIPEHVGEAEQKLRDEFYEKHKEEWNNMQYSEKQLLPSYIEFNAMPYPWDICRDYVLKQLGLGAVEEVDSYGGEEQGSEYYKVWYFKDHDVYIRIDGNYQSYRGVEFYQGYGKEVFPTEVTTTVYQ